MKTPPSSSIDALGARLKGRIVQPGDADYEELRSVFYGGGERRPAAVVRVADRDDIARVIAYAASRVSSWRSAVVGTVLRVTASSTAG